MPLSDAILDKAYDIYDEFGPDRRTPRPERLKQKIPGLSSNDLDELLLHMDRISKTVWSLAERGGEAKMRREEIVAALQAAHPFLKDAGLTRAVFLVNYYAWHEGYDK